MKLLITIITIPVAFLFLGFVVYYISRLISWGIYKSKTEYDRSVLINLKQFFKEVVEDGKKKKKS